MDPLCLQGLFLARANAFREGCKVSRSPPFEEAIIPSLWAELVQINCYQTGGQRPTNFPGTSATYQLHHLKAEDQSEQIDPQSELSRDAGGNENKQSHAWQMANPEPFRLTIFRALRRRSPRLIWPPGLATFVSCTSTWVKHESNNMGTHRNTPWPPKSSLRSRTWASSEAVSVKVVGKWQWSQHHSNQSVTKSDERFVILVFSKKMGDWPTEQNGVKRSIAVMQIEISEVYRALRPFVISRTVIQRKSWMTWWNCFWRCKCGTKVSWAVSASFFQGHLGLKRHPKPPREIVALLRWKPPVQSSLIAHSVFW